MSEVEIKNVQPHDGKPLVSRSFRLVAKMKNVDGWKPVERIDFFQKTFAIWYKDSITTERCLNQNDIECIKSVGTEIVIYGHESINHFADAIINSFRAGGGSKEDGERYFAENFC